MQEGGSSKQILHILNELFLGGGVRVKNVPSFNSGKKVHHSTEDSKTFSQTLLLGILKSEALISDWAYPQNQTCKMTTTRAGIKLFQKDGCHSSFEAKVKQVIPKSRKQAQ